MTFKRIKNFLIQLSYLPLYVRHISRFLTAAKHYSQDNPLELFTDKTLSPAMRFIIETEHYSGVYRAGWLELGRQVPLFFGEKLSDHIIGMLTILRVLRAGHRNDFPDVDWEEAVIMTIGHEYGEIRKGDFTPADGIPKEEKHRLEAEGVYGLLENVPNSKYDSRLWERYEAKNDPTARLVAEVDYLQMIIKARIYERRFNKNLEEFYVPEKRDKRLLSPVLQNLFAEIL